MKIDLNKIGADFYFLPGTGHIVTLFSAVQHRILDGISYWMCLVTVVATDWPFIILFITSGFLIFPNSFFGPTSAVLAIFFSAFGRHNREKSLRAGKTAPLSEGSV